MKGKAISDKSRVFYENTFKIEIKTVSVFFVVSRMEFYEQSCFDLVLFALHSQGTIVYLHLNSFSF